MKTKGAAFVVAVAALVAVACPCSVRAAGEIRWYQVDFAADLYRAVSAGRSGNILVSPYGAAAMMGVLATGAYDATAAAFAQTLRMDGAVGSDPSQIAGVFRAVRPMVGADGADGSGLSVTNVLWLAPTFYPQAEFLDRAHDAFNCDVRTVGRATPPLLATLGVPPPRDADLLVVNTLALDAEWEKSFDRANSREAVFHSPDGDATVTFLQDTRDAELCGASGCTVLKIPYKGTNNLEMLILLPNRGRSLSEVEEKVGGAFLSRLEARRWRGEVSVALPSFTLAMAGGDLRPALEQMGLGVAFGEEADFGRLSSRRVRLSGVRQSVAFRVDEAGTAPAVNVAPRKPGAEFVLHTPQQTFLADRPFLFIVRERVGGFILLMGRVVRP